MKKKRARGQREFQMGACQHLYMPYHAEIIFHKQFGKCTLFICFVQRKNTEGKLKEQENSPCLRRFGSYNIRNSMGEE